MDLEKVNSMKVLYRRMGVPTAKVILGKGEKIGHLIGSNREGRKGVNWISKKRRGKIGMLMKSMA